MSSQLKIRKRVEKSDPMILTEILIGRTDSQKAISVKALWDTGMSLSSISNRMVEKFQFILAGDISAINVNGKHNSEIYSGVKIYIPELKWFIRGQQFPMYTYDEDGVHDVIIGLNIIKLGDFCITRSEDNTHNIFEFSI